MSRRSRRAHALAATACTLAALVLFLGGPAGGQEPDTGGPREGGEPGVQGDPGALRREGRRLFAEGCASCHGEDARGIDGRAPSLRGVGALSADFYLRTGRMPMEDPEDEPQRKETFYTERQIDALVAYVGGLGGPPVPEVHPERGDLAEGRRLFGEMCAGCHQIVARGGVITSARVPDLQASEPIDVAEAVRIGPYVMPPLAGRLEDREIDSLARFVVSTRDPEDRGGWGIGHIGPIPEGMVTWLLAGFALVLTVRLIGERTTS